MKSVRFLRSRRALFLWALLILTAGSGYGATRIWTGNTSADWGTAGNWDTAVPLATDDVIITNAVRSPILSGATPSLNSLVISNSTLIFTNWSTVLNATTVTIQTNGVVTHAAGFTNVVVANTNRVNINCTDLVIENGGRINVDGKGHYGANGPGAGPWTTHSYHQGGGYGGQGGGGEETEWAGLPYGSASDPFLPGSGGGSYADVGYQLWSGKGGGAVLINASGTLTVRGTITANGSTNQSTYTGGGSGGGINIVCGTLAGDATGLIRADGGGAFNTVVGAGGGGRIAMHYTSLGSPCDVRFSASPGTNGWAYGDPDNRWHTMPQPGTLWLPDTQLLAETLDQARFAGPVSIVGIGSWSPNSLTVSNCSVYFSQSNFVLTVANNITVDARGSLGIGAYSTYNTATNYTLNCGGNLMVTNGGALYAFSGGTNGSANAYGALVNVTGDLLVSPASWVYPVCHGTNGGAPTFRMANLVVETNGGFNASTKGFRDAKGPGSLGNAGGNTCPGGSHGGKAGHNGADGSFTAVAPEYDNPAKPLMPGSGGSTYDAAGYRGGGGGGGGVVWVEATGAIAVRGAIKANGGRTFLSYRAGGAGGGIYLKCNTFGGTSDGAIGADGAGANDATAGGGGGGRIALDYTSVNASRDVRFSTRAGTNEWSDLSDDRWYWHSRQGTLWLPDTALLSPLLANNQFREVSIMGFPSWSVSSLTVSNCSLTFAQNQVLITVTNDIVVDANAALGLGLYSANTNGFLMCGGSLTLTNGGALYLYGGFTNAPATTNYSGFVGITNNLTVGSGSWVYTYAHEVRGGAPAIWVGGNALVEANAGFNANARGYSTMNGPGLGGADNSYRGGGGYGGKGGSSAEGTVGGITYGSATLPIDAGSGANSYYSSATAKHGAGGGGAIRLEAGGTVTLRGLMTANGGNATAISIYSGGGAGGGIYVKCNTFSGAGGVVQAKGGNPTAATTSGNGSGGRIAIDYQVLDPTHDVRFSAAPGSLSWAGLDLTNRWRDRAAMGTLALPDTGMLLNPMVTNFADRVFLYLTRTNLWNVESLTVSNCAVALANKNFILTVTNDLRVVANGEFGLGGDPNGSNYTLAVGGSIYLTNGGNMVVYAGQTNGMTNANLYGALVDVTNDIVISAGSILYPESHEVNGGSPLFRLNNLYIQPNGSVDASAKGFGKRQGPGKGADSGGGPGGAGHGGRGGDGQTGTGSGTYGRTNGPVQPGSGGGAYVSPGYYNYAGAGGGAVRVDARGTIKVEGSILAQGGSGLANIYYGSGASGGGIYLNCTNFIGTTTAVIRADGGSSWNMYSYPGGGGGGRIAVWRNVPADTREGFLAGDPAAIANVIVASNFPNYDGAMTVTGGVGWVTANAAQPGTMRFLRNNPGATYYLQIHARPNDTFGASQPRAYGTHEDIPINTGITNSVVSPADELAGTRHACIGWDLKNDVGTPIANDVTTQAVFTVTTNLYLYWNWTNQYLLTVGPAADTNGSVNAGTVNGWYSNGVVVAGIQATPSNGWIFAQWTGDVPPANATDNPLTLNMTQARTITANFIPFVIYNKTWTGIGNWTNWANWSPTGIPSTVDNALIGSGTCTIWQATYAGSLVISNNAALMFTNWNTKLFIGSDLTVLSNGVMTTPAYTNNGVSNRVNFACSNLTIMAGGRIDVEGKGFFPWTGPMPGQNFYYGGGGTYGGRGGRGFPEASGINFPMPQTYGSISAPTDPGSGGGAYPSGGFDYQVQGGRGGGAIRAEVSGTATIDGVMSANGGNSSGGYGGGGSGGSIWLTCGTLAGNGSGVIRANGGGVYGPALSGGGGGGRIAVAYQNLAPSHYVKFSAGVTTSEYATADMPNRWMNAAEMGTLWLPDTALLTESLTDGKFQGVSLAVSGLTSWAVGSLTITNASIFLAVNNFHLTVTNDLVIGAGGSLGIGAYDGTGTNYVLNCGGNLILTNGGKFYVFSGATNSVTEGYGARVDVTNDMIVGPASWVYAHSHWTNAASPRFTMNNLTIENGGGINAIGTGYGWLRGPGVGEGMVTYCGAGGYGGRGGGGADATFGGPAYGSVSSPSDPGSAGSSHSSYIYHPGWGGGFVRLEASGAATVNGSILANGSAALGTYGSAGSGGGIYLKCAAFGGASSGLLSAQGGIPFNNYGGAGGGGRIALDYTSVAATHAVRFSVAGGTNSWATTDPNSFWQHLPQEGTIWLPDTQLLKADLTDGQFNGGRLLFPGTVTWSVDSLVVSNTSLTLADSGFQLIVTNAIVVGTGGALGIGGDNNGSNYLATCGTLQVNNGGAFYAYGGVTNAVITNYGALVTVGGALAVGDNSWIYPVAEPTNGGTVLFRAGEVQIGANAGFNANAKGYAGRTGKGKGTSLDYAGGAGYGGRGGDGAGSGAGGVAYGSTNVPVDPGSGGGTYGYAWWYFARGGLGGGAVRLEVGGTLTLSGSLLANGGKGGSTDYGGGGAGGTIYVACNSFKPAANSMLKATGGEGFGNSGGGGGGRIAVWMGVPPPDRALILAGATPTLTTIATNFDKFPMLTVNATNGAGYASANLAQPGTVRLFWSIPRGTVLTLW